MQIAYRLSVETKETSAILDKITVTRRIVMKKIPYPLTV